MQIDLRSRRSRARSILPNLGGVRAPATSRVRFVRYTGCATAPPPTCSALPLLDGYEATRRIKADPALKHIPIIVVTSYALGGDEAKARAAGCDAYVAKPYSPKALLAKVREYAR